MVRQGRLTLSRAHTSARAQQSPLIQSILIRYQAWLPCVILVQCVSIVFTHAPSENRQYTTFLTLQSVKGHVYSTAGCSGPSHTGAVRRLNLSLKCLTGERIIGGDVDKNLWSWRKSKTKIWSSKLTRFLMIWFHRFVYHHLMACRFSLMTWCTGLRKMPFSLLSWTDYFLSTKWYGRTASLCIYSRTGGWLAKLCLCLLMVLLSWGGRQ